jgi:hypothetical protein
MKRYLTLALASLALSAPALAGSITIEFDASDSDPSVWLFLNGGTAIGPGGTVEDYTWDPETSELCGDLLYDRSAGCITFEVSEDDLEIGDTTGYTTSDGKEGTATIIAIEG